MWVALVVAAAFFLAMLAMGYFALRDLTGESSAAAPAAPEAHAEACEVCEGGLPARPATSDQVVFEVEHRIDADLQEVAFLLARTPPGSASRLYRA